MAFICKRENKIEQFLITLYVLGGETDVLTRSRGTPSPGQLDYAGSS